MTLTFMGAARTVTGSKHLLDAAGHRVLIDCGLFQGLKELRERNWAALPVPANTIEAAILTHAHLDHTGYLPRLVAQGFKGRVFCTPATAVLTRIVLEDAARLQEEDAERANRRQYTKHSPALPLFTEADAARALRLLQPVGYERPMPVAPGITVEFINAGHLLGSSYARVQIADTGKTILFGGDLGRYGRPVLPDPRPVAEADVLLVESTYGDRLHDPDDGGARLADVINRTVERGGRVIIPSFAIGRVEEVLYWLRHLEDDRKIPILPVYVDSPMATAALGFYRDRLHELDPELRRGEREMRAFSTTRLTLVGDARESADLAGSSGPAIVIAASGMATGGRVLRHLHTALPDARNTVLFVGYQAAGTRGRALLDGADATAAAHLAEWATRAAPSDRDAQAFKRDVYARRSEVETSLMARGIFRAASEG